MNLKQRIAWLRRMPMHWRLLFGTQAVIMTTAFNFRLNEVRKARMIEEMKEEMELNKSGDRNEVS